MMTFAENGMVQLTDLRGYCMNDDGTPLPSSRKDSNTYKCVYLAMKITKVSRNQNETRVEAAGPVVTADTGAAAVLCTICRIASANK